MSVLWHDLECGAYLEDLPLWRSLAEAHGDPVLEIGAGTGRVALELARCGYRVTALDQDPEFASELRSRAAGLALDVVRADAREFDLGQRFDLCIVPMQTVQLLGGSDGRRSFLRCAREHLLSEGVLAVALSAQLEPYELQEGLPAPLPDIQERDGVVYSSQPVAVREEADGFVLERRRETVSREGRHTREASSVRLDRLHPTEFEREAVTVGFRLAGRAEISATADYTGSIVVIARA